MSSYLTHPRRALFELAPVSSGICTVSQYGNDIHNAEVPQLALSIPFRANVVGLKQVDVAHSSSILPSIVILGLVPGIHGPIRRPESGLACFGGIGPWHRYR